MAGRVTEKPLDLQRVLTLREESVDGARSLSGEAIRSGTWWGLLARLYLEGRVKAPRWGTETDDRARQRCHSSRGDAQGGELDLAGKGPVHLRF